jgi:serine protease Do
MILAATLIFGRAATARAEPAPAVLEAEARRIAVMDKAKDAVLAIFPASGQGGGSGVVITPDGYALSNFHVVVACGKAMQCGMADGRVYDAVVVGIDPTGDVALIKLFGRDDFPRAVLGDSDRVRQGDSVFAMGNPFLLATDFRPTATFGIISGVHRYQFPSETLLEYTDCLQTDASINPGNSGGPLFDDQGRVIGINGRASFEKRGRVNVGAAYAISINQIKNFLGVLRSGSIVDHATLGAQVAADADGRVVVIDVLDTADAFRRGLRLDDEIVRFAGRRITTANEFKNVLGILPKGWRVPLTYRRDGKMFNVLVRLAGVHSPAELLEGASVEPPPHPDPNPKHPQKPAPAPSPIPEIVEKHFQEKLGCANYYFNSLNRDRVWKTWTAECNLNTAKGAWRLSGPLPSGGAFQIDLTDAGATLKVPSGETRWTAAENLGASPLPPGSGGLLPSLWLWRTFALAGPSSLGDVSYYGTAPVVGCNGLVDVLIATYRGVEAKFYFDPTDGRLCAIEVYPDEESDPCELYFSDTMADGNLRRPSRIEVRFGDERFALLVIGTFNVEKRKETPQ